MDIYIYIVRKLRIIMESQANIITELPTEIKKQTNTLKYKEKYTCVCGVTLRKDGKAKHERTQKHVRHIEGKPKDYIRAYLFPHTKFYKLVSAKTGNVLISHTTQKSISQAFSQHRSSYRCGRENSAKKIFDDGDVYTELIEAYPCNNIGELNCRLLHHFKTIPNINSHLRILNLERVNNEYLSKCNK